MSWDVLCPQSGMVLDSFGALRTLKTHYVCGLCDVSGDTDLDDFIEVTFSISPKLRRLPHHDPETLPVEDFHWKLHFGHDGRLSAAHQRTLSSSQTTAIVTNGLLMSHWEMLLGRRLGSTPHAPRVLRVHPAPIGPPARL